jgi:hypothetical protein
MARSRSIIQVKIRAGSQPAGSLIFWYNRNKAGIVNRKSSDSQPSQQYKKYEQATQPTTMNAMDKIVHAFRLTDRRQSSTQVVIASAAPFTASAQQGVLLLPVSGALEDAASGVIARPSCRVGSPLLLVS